MTAERLDAHWQTNARSTLLLTREFAALHADATIAARQPGERIERAADRSPNRSGACSG